MPPRAFWVRVGVSVRVSVRVRVRVGVRVGQGVGTIRSSDVPKQTVLPRQLV